MLTTDELKEAVAGVPYPAWPMDRDKKVRLRNEYKQKISALEARWVEWLHKEYLPGVGSEIERLVFSMAWADGHSEGYGSVEWRYEDIAGLVKAVIARDRES